jgi:hypothetical protein
VRNIKPLGVSIGNMPTRKIDILYSMIKSSLAMAVCPFCNRYISATACQRYRDHLEVCKRWYDAEGRATFHQKEVEAVKEERRYEKPSQTTIFNVTGDAVFGNQYQHYNIGLFYPQTKAVMDLALDQAKRLPIATFDTPQKLDMRMQEIQDANSGEMIKLLAGTNPGARNQVLSFLAEVAKIFRQRLNEEGPPSTVTIEAADDFIEECIKDQKLITSG